MPWFVLTTFQAIISSLSIHTLLPFQLLYIFENDTKSVQPHELGFMVLLHEVGPEEILMLLAPMGSICNSIACSCVLGIRLANTVRAGKAAEGR
jgi:Na+/H+-dicarboxylate symporter